MSPAGTGVGQIQTPSSLTGTMGGQTQLSTGRSPRSAPAPLTVPEFTYFFFLHFFLGFSTCGRRAGLALVWNVPGPSAWLPHPTSYTVNWLCARESSR